MLVCPCLSCCDAPFVHNQLWFCFLLFHPCPLLCRLCNGATTRCSFSPYLCLLSPCCVLAFPFYHVIFCLRFTCWLLVIIPWLGVFRLLPVVVSSHDPDAVVNLLGFVVFLFTFAPHSTLLFRKFGYFAFLLTCCCSFRCCLSCAPTGVLFLFCYCLSFADIQFFR